MRKRLTLKFERMKEAASNGLRREISEDFRYDKGKLKHIKHVLHNVNVALGNLVSGLNEFSRIKGPDISPDGLLGGLGYIMSLRDVKETINNSVRSLSDVADSLADELTNPRWKVEDDKEVKELIKEKEDVEEKVEEEVPEITPEDIITSTEIEKAASDKKSSEYVFLDAVKNLLISQLKVSQ